MVLIFSDLLLQTGCSPSNSFVISDDASLKKLNGIEKERPVRVTTLDSIYIGQNIYLTRDSTTLENITIRLEIVSLSDIKEIQYDSGSTPKRTIKLKDNQVFKANEIHISQKDSILRFNKILTALFNFPTKDITRIQVIDSDAMMGGIAAGTMGGTLLGMALGYVVGSNAKTVTNSGQHSDESTEAADIVLMTCGGGIMGVGFGVALGHVFGKWDDIYIAYQFEK